VRDPYDTISPYHDWGPVPVTGKALGQALGVAGHVVDATVSRNPSKRVKTVKLTTLRRGAQGTSSVRGSAVASALSLRSTWFSVAVLSLQPPQPNPAVSPGTRVSLTGVVRGVRSVVLQARSSGQPWKPLRAIVPAVPTGGFHLYVKPKVTTQYRLATAEDAAGAVRIRVKAATLK
jgi:hypothetical protein